MRNNIINYWPVSSQKHLLRATFLQGQESIQAWQQWKSQINMDDYPDPGSSKLLPQLYHNLKEQGLNDPLMMKFKGVSRKAWYKNQRFFESVTEPLSTLHQARIKTMVLYDPALALHYADYPLNSTATLALFVPTRQAIPAVECLQQAGWVSETNLPPASIAAHLTSAYLHIFDDAFQRKIQLHWHLLPECCQLNADEDFWDAALETQVRDVPVYMLTPADHLLHICVQDTAPAVIPLFLRAVDAMLVIKAASTTLNWERLVAQTTKRKLVLPVLTTLMCLQEALGDVIPPEVLTELRHLPISKAEMLEYKLKTHKRSIVRRSSRLWFNHLRHFNARQRSQKIMGFPTYLKHFWQLENLWQVPGQALSAVQSRMRQSS